MSPDTRRFVVPPDAAGQRLDQFLSAAAELPRSRVKAAVDAGLVTLDGAATKAGQRLRGGEAIDFRPLPPEPPDALPEPIPLDLVYEDDDLLVVNKPAGMVTHPARGNFTGTLVNALLAHGGGLSSVAGAPRPGIVHRLDKETSGLLVVAKHDAAHRHLAAQIQARTATRLYLALTRGEPDFVETVVDAPLGRHPTRRLEMAVRDDGRPARTHLRVRERFAVAALLEARLETGRTHQVRVHCAQIGYPLLGDRVYGLRRAARFGPLPEPVEAAVAGLAGQALHAAELSFDHPADGRAMHFAAPPPPAFTALLDALRDL